MVGTQIDLSLLESFTSSTIASRQGDDRGERRERGERVVEREGPPSRRLERIPSDSSLTENLTLMSVVSRFFYIDVRRWRAMIGVPALIATVGKFLFPPSLLSFYIIYYIIILLLHIIIIFFVFDFF